MVYKIFSVIFLFNLSDRFILSVIKERTTISVLEAVAEYNRRIKLIENGHNVSDSLSSVPIESVEDLDPLKIIGNGNNALIDNSLRTTLHPNFVKNVRRPLGYYKQLLQNQSQSKVPKTEVTHKTSISTSTRWTPYPDYNSAEERSLQRKCPERINHIIRLRANHEMKKKTNPTTRWTPYPNYNSTEERSLQRKCPERKHHIRRLKAYRDLKEISADMSYSEESVPSSCGCHAGNWSESYSVWDKWKKKECKPGFLNLEYGLNQEGTRFRKGHEPEWYKDEQTRKAQSRENADHSSRELRKRNGSRKKHHAGPHVLKSQQPIGYNPQTMGYPAQPVAYPQQQMGNHPQLYGYPQQPLGYHPGHGYYPHPVPQYNPQYYHPNPHLALDPIVHEKLEALHREIKELKDKTTVSLWEQYLKLKEKFEPVQSTLSKTSAKNKYENYRKQEKQVPYFSKLYSNVNQHRPKSPYNQSQYYNNQAHQQFSELQQRTIQDIYRQNHFLKEDPPSNGKDVPHFQRITRDHIHKNEPFNRFLTSPRYNTVRYTPSPRQHYRGNDPFYYDKKSFMTRGTPSLARSEWQSKIWSTRPREGYYQKPSVRENYVQDIKSNVHNTYRTEITRTSTPSTTLNVKGETTTEDALRVYQRYKAQYEFPDYVGHKRHMLRVKEKEAKRKLYKARGLEYDEDPPRTTTIPSTTTVSSYTFENMMEYYKWMFGDESLPIEKETLTPFNNAPTFDMDHDEGRKAYLKWLLSDKTLEIDPIS